MKFNYSFLMLTFNQEETVRASVQSALSQQCSPMEIVISDDCSRDGTFDIIKETIAEYSGPHRVVLNRNNRNLGVNAHIQYMHEKTAGDVIIAASGDDISIPCRSGRIMEVFERDEPLLAFSHAVVIGPDGQPAERPYYNATLYKSFDPLVVATSRSAYLGATSAWHKALYSKYGPVTPLAYEDLVFAFRAALEGRIALIDEALVQYRIGSGLSSFDESALSVEDFKRRKISDWRTYAAVFGQRRNDAVTFGLNPNSPIWAALDQAEKRARIRLAYLEHGPWKAIQVGGRSVTLALRMIRSARRELRKHSRAVNPRSREQ